MYTPKHFLETRTEVLHQLIGAQPLGTLITLQGGALVADEVVFSLDPSAGALGTLRAHVARANPLSQQHDPVQPVLAVFKGAQAYVSPSWYVTKLAHGKAVPTWNYIAVQASGLLQAKDGDDVWLRQQLDALTHQHEQHLPQPWQPSDAPPDYIAQMMRAIVGIEIPIDRLVGKWKVSQNQPEVNRAGVIQALQDRAPKMAQAVRDAAQVTHQRAVDAAIDDWNALDARSGSFADAHIRL